METVQLIQGHFKLTFYVCKTIKKKKNTYIYIYASSSYLHIKLTPEVKDINENKNLLVCHASFKVGESFLNGKLLLLQLHFCH